MSVDKDSFNKIKNSLLHMDPVWFVENYLNLEGKPFRLTGNGFKPFADIYRYIGIKALEPGSKGVCFVKGRQVGGTTMAGALECFFMGCGMFGASGRPPMRIIHTFPILEQSSGYSKSKLSSLISSSINASTQPKFGGKIKSYMQSLIDDSHDSSDSLSFKQFVGGNQLWIDATGADGDRLRGKTADMIFIDEFQDTPSDAVSNILNMLKQSKYGEKGRGVRIFFGTPKKKGSDFYKIWAASSQQFYFLGCEECKRHFPLYTPGSDDWEKVWIHTYVVKCTHCGHEQDKNGAAERGKWVANKDNNESDYVGFHINQLYMPHIPKEAIIAEKPGIHPTNTERMYQNEVLGEFYQGDSSPITIEEIEQFCADKGRKMRNRIPAEEGLKIFLGIDYGARADLEQMAETKKKTQQGQSYTTAVILAAKGPKLFSVEFALKFKRNDLESKKSLIDKLMRDYSVNLCIGDIGFSQDFSTMMHTAYGDRYLVSRAHSKVNDKVKFTEDAYPKEIVFERDHFIGEMFELLKGGNVKFPYGDFDKIGWLVNHCASMDIKPSISRFGDPTIHYVKGGEPNDGLMALLNAYIAYKFYVTNGFKVKNPLVMEQNMKAKKQPLALTGFIKRRI